MNVVRLLIVFFVGLTSAFSLECGLSENLEMNCSKTKRVKNLEELNEYMSDYAAISGIAKNLLIDFDLNTTDDLSIHSPCKVIFKRLKDLKAKNLCVNGKEGIVFQNNITLNAQDVSLHSKKRIVIRHHANITANNLSLLSSGDGLDSRVHIRHDSQVNVNNLTLVADARATLGHTSTYQIQNSLNINSKLEFSAIWKNSTINAKEVKISSDNRARFSKGVVLNATTMDISSPECNASNLTVAAASGGNCFDTTRPVAKLTRSAKEINAGQSVSFSAKKSSDDKGIIKYEFFVNSELVRSNQNPEFTHKFVEAGIFYVELVIEDADGYRSSARRKVIVNETLATSEGSYFDYRIVDNTLSLIFHQLIPHEEIASAKYIITELNGEEGVFEFPITNFYHRSEKIFEDFGGGQYKVGLSVTDIYNRTFLYERAIDYTGESEFYKEPPIIEYKVTQVAPKEIMVDFRKIFDPSDRLQWIDIDWGDGTVEEADYISTAFLKHKYSTTGTFEIKILVAKEIDGKQSISESIRLVTVTNDEVPQLAPIIDYNIFISDFAPYVTFNIDRSISPNAEIVSVVFDHGDGSFYTGKDFIHTHFYEPGAYISKLTVTDSNGLTMTQSLQVVISDQGNPLIAELKCDENLSLLRVECEVVGIDKFSELSEMSIDWGDGSVESIDLHQGDFTWEDVVHNYASKGEYSIILTVKNFRNEKVDSSFSVNFNGGGDGKRPFASIDCAPTGSGKEVRCDFSDSYDSDGHIEVFKVSMGDGVVYTFNNSAELVHSYATNGLYIVDLEVTDNSGLTSTASNSFELVNQAPLINVFCDSIGPHKLSCYSYSTDPDGFIANTLFDWGEGIQSGTEDSFETTLQSGGIKHVHVSVFDNEGKVSSTQIDVVVAENVLPSVDFLCRTPSVGEVKCENSSIDIDGEVVSFEWNVSGNVVRSDVLSLSNIIESPINISLTVTDNLGGTSSLSKSIEVLLNTAPIASAECLESGFFTIECDGSSSSDQESTELMYTWYLDNVIIGNEQKLSYKFDKLSDSVLKLEVKDSDGAKSEAVVSYSILKPEVSLNIGCTQYDNYAVRCTGFYPFQINEESASFNWFVNGELVSEAKELDYLSSETETLSIRLFISMGNGLLELDKTEEFTFTELPQNMIKSSASLVQVSEVKTLYNKLDELTLELRDGSPLFSEDGNISDLVISINGETTVDEGFLFENNIFKLRGLFAEGLNHVEITFLDDLGRTVNFQSSYIFGSKSIHLNNPENRELDITFYDFDHNEIYKIQSNESNITVNDIPSIDMYLVSVLGKLTRINHFEENSLEIDLADFSLPSEVNDSNFDINNSLQGWNLQKGSYSQATSSIDPFTGKERYSSKLLPNSDGVIKIESRLSLKDYTEKIYELPFSRSLNTGDILIAYISNLKSGKVVKTVYKSIQNTESILSSEITDSLFSELSGEEEELLISFYLKTNSISSEFSFTNILIPYAIAQSSTSPSGKSSVSISHYKMVDTIVTFNKVRDNQGFRIAELEPLSVLPSRPFADNYGAKINNENVYKVLIDAKIVRPLGQEVFVYICDFYSPSPNINNCVEIRLEEGENFFTRNKENEYDVIFKESDLSYTPEFFFLCLGTRSSFSCAKNENGYRFRKLISLSKLYPSALRYGLRKGTDNSDGAVDWISSSHMGLFSWLELDTVLGKVRFDDAGHVSSYKKDVEIAGHLEHHYGLSIDLRFLATTPPPGVVQNSEIFQGATSPTNSIYDAIAINQILDNARPQYIEKVLLNYNGTDFGYYVNNTCLSSGYKMSKILRHTGSGHRNHFHLKFFDALDAGNIQSREISLFSNEEIVRRTAYDHELGHSFKDESYLKKEKRPVIIPLDRVDVKGSDFYFPKRDENIYSFEDNSVKVVDWRKYQVLDPEARKRMKLLWNSEDDGDSCFEQVVQLDFDTQKTTVDTEKLPKVKEFYSSGESLELKFDNTAFSPLDSFGKITISLTGELIKDGVKVNSIVKDVESVISESGRRTFNVDLYQSIPIHTFSGRDDLEKTVRLGAGIESIDGTNQTEVFSKTITICPMGTSVGEGRCNYPDPATPELNPEKTPIVKEEGLKSGPCYGLEDNRGYKKECTYHVRCSGKWSKLVGQEEKVAYHPHQYNCKDVDGSFEFVKTEVITPTLQAFCMNPNGELGEGLDLVCN
ncbi:PKD domain-containing protein [Halobacteriovorax sp. HLS]|uniref:PKD domain-containing protein n=1 Tax=Halobacteriovorax sp. HLS TaxID=2234000 RepID=UPI000FDA5601|nr:PKD domain-containing protein [Halobacteriovorax sp. HLS]